ncbi:MAG: class I SAM-dependent methyltransferase [Actinomycetota bacterium]|nr:MAG: class I SAM-dependent methyltransferase [Actinomycetota bacterium]
MFHAADGYDRLMGRFLPTLAPAFADAAGITAGQRVLDVGCGPGGLTRELAARVGPSQVTAIDPSAPFVAACRQRVPAATVLTGVAEELPFSDSTFDAALSSLVVGFMSDAPAGVRQMARVTRPGGVVALNFWDVLRMRSLQVFWQAAARAIGAVPNDRALVGAREGDLAELLIAAGLVDVVATEIEAVGNYDDLDDLWSGYTEGVGPIGQYVAALDAAQLRAVRAAVAEDLRQPTGPFTLRATAWVATGRVPV